MGMFVKCKENGSHSHSQWIHDACALRVQKYKELGVEINLFRRRNMKCFHWDSKTDIGCDDAEIKDQVVFSMSIDFSVINALLPTASDCGQRTAGD